MAIEEEAKEKELRLALYDIIHGYSKLRIVPFEGSAMFSQSRKYIKCYAKHFNFFDQIELDAKYEKSFNRAKESGLQTHADMLKSLSESEEWTDKDEKEINQKKLFIESLKTTISKLIVPSQIETVKANLEKAQKEFEALHSQKNSLFGTTCEDYASSQLNTQTILSCLYEDSSLSKPLFSETDQEYLDNADIGVMVMAYNEAVEKLSIDNIKKLSVSSFFTSYFSLVEDSPHAFFKDIHVHELTFYQLNLLTYAKVLRSIIRNTQPPEGIMNDPDKLLEWSEKGEKARSVVEKSQNKDGFSVMGATKDDYEKMGVERQGKNIFDLAKEKKGKGGDGKTLGIMDFIDK